MNIEERERERETEREREVQTKRIRQGGVDLRSTSWDGGVDEQQWAKARDWANERGKERVRQRENVQRKLGVRLGFGGGNNKKQLGVICNFVCICVCVFAVWC